MKRSVAGMCEGLGHVKAKSKSRYERFREKVHESAVPFADQESIRLLLQIHFWKGLMWNQQILYKNVYDGSRWGSVCMKDVPVHRQSLGTVSVLYSTARGRQFSGDQVMAGSTKTS